LGRVVRNVIFDWSGTLVNDLPAVWEASNHVFRRAGAPEMSMDEFRREFRLPFESFYRERLSGHPRHVVEGWFHERFAEVRDNVEPTPFAREFLDYGRARGWRMFLLSAVHPEHFPAQTAGNGFDRYFERAFLGVVDKCETIREVIARHQLEARTTLFVGDMEHDMDAAKAGGVAGVAVLTGYTPLPQLRRSDPALIVEHLGELRGILERHDGRLPGPDDETSAAGARRPIATVGALIFRADGRVLMVRTNKWSNLWGIPGGKIEYGEASEEALRRELREETGLEVGEIRFEMVQDAVEPPEFYRRAHFLLLNYTCHVAGDARVALNHEAQDHGWFTLQEAAALALNQPTRVLLDAVRHRLANERGGGRNP
jgi:phosphoglycolate phosphatase